MLTRLYNSVVLLVLPSIETILAGIARALLVVEAREAALEQRIEDKVVSLGQAAQSRREAIQAVHKHFDKVNAKNISAINADRAEVRAAVNARAAVEQLINRG